MIIPYPTYPGDEAADIAVMQLEVVVGSFIILIYNDRILIKFFLWNKDTCQYWW